MGIQKNGLTQRAFPARTEEAHLCAGKFPGFECEIVTVPTGHRIPAKGETLGIRVCRSPRSEGTLHIPGWWTRARTAPMRRSFRTRRFRHFGPRVAPWAGMQGPVGAMWNSGLGQMGVDAAFAVMVAVILRNRVAVREFLGPLFPG